LIQSKSEFPAKSKDQEGRFAVRRKRFSVEQIVAILKQAEVGVPVADLIRQAGISEQTFYRWKKQYVGLEVDQVRQLRQVQEENLRLKRLVAELILDKTMLQDVLAKNCKALAAPPEHHLPARALSGKRATGLPSLPARPRDLPVSELLESEDGTAVAYAGDCQGTGSLRVSQDPSVAEPGGLERQSLLGVSTVLRRRLSPTAAPQSSTPSGGATPGAVSFHGSEPGLEFGFCDRSVSGRTALSRLDGGGHLYPRKLGH
jgi:putative transposase